MPDRDARAFPGTERTTHPADEPTPPRADSAHEPPAEWQPEPFADHAPEPGHREPATTATGERAARLQARRQRDGRFAGAARIPESSHEYFDEARRHHEATGQKRPSYFAAAPTTVEQIDADLAAAATRRLREIRGDPPSR